MDREEYRHLVITRMNVRVPGHPPPDVDWLRRRLTIFRDTMLPSMRRQTCIPDRWVLLCDARGPKWFRNDLESITDGVAELLFIEEEFEPAGHTSALKSTLSASSDREWLMTTRVDNDDCISPRFIERIQHHAQPCKEFLNFVNGLQYADGLIYFRMDPASPFISFMEPADDDASSVYIDGHDKLAPHAAIRQIRCRPLWMQVVHGGNIANEVRGIRVPVRAASHLQTGLELRAENPLPMLASMTSSACRMAVIAMSSPTRRRRLASSLDPRRAARSRRDA